jgi:hypothetical protein
LEVRSTIFVAVTDVSDTLAEITYTGVDSVLTVLSKTAINVENLTV